MADTPSLEEVMSEAIDAGDGSSSQEETVQAVDPIKNIKAEFARKSGNMEAQLASTQAQLDALMQQLQTQSASAKPSKPAKDLLYDNPEEFIAQTVAHATAQADAAVTRRMSESARLNNAVAEVQARYAEFGQAGSEASALALQKAAKLPASIRGTAEGAKQAMLEAAMELELVPVSKKKAQAASNDDFVAGSSQTGGKAPARSKKENLEREFARLLGADLNDKNVAKEFEKAQKREKWGQPQ